MDNEQRITAWWNTLNRTERVQALTVVDALPDWMAASLQDAGLIVVNADLEGHSPVLLMPTRVREFLEEAAFGDV